MGLLYKHLHNNGVLELYFNNKLPTQILNNFLSQPGIKLSSCQQKLTIQPTLSGGKQAFRQLMRNIGRTTTKSQNQSMSRNLSGRRIRDVENEKRLQMWIRGHSEREAARQVARTKKLEKLAKLSRDEQDRKKFLDASFDETANEMMAEVDDALEASLRLPGKRKFEASSSSSTAGKGSGGKNSSNFKKPRKAFLDEDLSDVSDSSEEEKVEILETITEEAKLEAEPKPVVSEPIEKVASPCSLPTKLKKLTPQPFKPRKTAKNVPKKKVLQPKNLVQVKATPKTYRPINIRKIQTKEGFSKYTTDHLKHELTRRGLKAGGTDDQKIHRLYFVRNLKWDRIPKKFKSAGMV